MASIAGMLPSDVNVLREGRQMTMPAKELVVGDLVYVSLGDKVRQSNGRGDIADLTASR